MEFICSKKDLQNCISAVERIVTTKSTLPIIGNVLLEAKKDIINILANNLEIGMKLSVKADISKEGSILVPAKTLSGIVNKLPNQDVKFKLMEKGMMRISYNQSFFDIHTLPPDEFPALAKVKEAKVFSLDPEIFVSMVKQTIFAVSSSEDKYVLTGVLFEVGKSSVSGDSSNLRMISTDGYRLSKRAEKIKMKGEGKASVIIPAKALQEISRLVEMSFDEETELKISLAKDQVSFKFGQVYLVSRIIQGQFPDYRQVIPKKTSAKVVVDSKDFLQAAERAAVVASGSANIVKFEVRKGQLHLTASTPDVGTIDEIIEAEINGETKFQIAFNIRLITDMMKTIEEEKVVVEVTEALGPGKLRPFDKEEFVYIVMPIRTQGAA